MWIIVNHYEDPCQPTSISWKVRPLFFRGSDEISDLEQTSYVAEFPAARKLGKVTHPFARWGKWIDTTRVSGL